MRQSTSCIVAAAVTQFLAGTVAAATPERGTASLPGVASEDATVLKEVTVTAQRREERLQDVPVSATVFSTEQLERAQITNLDALQYAAPNLTNAPSQTTGTSTRFAMRGQFSRDTTPTLDPAIGLYLDGVYIGRMTGANFDLVDVERVEVLRGPQGTLYGRNTIGGAINLIPNRPTLKPEGSVNVTVGSYGRADFTAVGNIPFAQDRFAVRVAASHAEHRGYARNILRGADLNDNHTDFGRLQLRFVPSDRLDLDLAVDYSRINTGAQWRTLLWVSPDAATLPIILGNPGDNLANYVDPLARSVAADSTGPVETRVWGASATLTATRARFTLKSISAYRGLTANAFNSDQDGTPYDLGVIRYRRDHQLQFSQELQWYGRALGGRLDWIGGFHYFNENARFDQQFRVFVPASSRWTENLPSGDAHNQSLAAYAQLTYAMTPRLRMTAGARYTDDGRQLTSRNARIVNGTELCQLDPTIRDQPGACRATLPERRFRYQPWTLGVELTPLSDSMFYAKLSRGERSGGYNLRGVTLLDLSTFEPERVTSYELGAKADLFGHRLRVNVAVYRSLLDDIQLLQREPSTPGGPGTAFIQNAGKARIQGGELEVTGLVGRLRLAGTVGLTSAAYTRLRPDVVEVTIDSRFLDTPDMTASLAADLPVAFRFGQINMHADYGWRDSVVFEYNANSHASQAAYGLLNAMLSTWFERSRFELSLWVRNLTDRRYITAAFYSDFYTSATPGDPRTYGISLMYRAAGQ